MTDFRFKDLTVDNAFDFCEVLAVIGVEQVIGAFDKDEIQQLQESGTDMKEVGIVIAMKVCGILIKNISKAILGVVGVVICGIYVVATCDLKGTQNIAMAIFTAIVQGILVAGLSNYVNQVFKQLNKTE